MVIDPAAIGDDTGTVIIAGDLTVRGTTTSINSTEVNIGDRIILLNSGLGDNDSPTQDAGIQVKRGSQSNVNFIWNETNEKWSTGGKDLTTGSGQITCGAITSTGDSTMDKLTLPNNYIPDLSNDVATKSYVDSITRNIAVKAHATFQNPPTFNLDHVFLTNTNETDLSGSGYFISFKPNKSNSLIKISFDVGVITSWTQGQKLTLKIKQGTDVRAIVKNIGNGNAAGPLNTKVNISAILPAVNANTRTYVLFAEATSVNTNTTIDGKPVGIVGINSNSGSEDYCSVNCITVEELYQ